MIPIYDNGAQDESGFSDQYRPYAEGLQQAGTTPALHLAAVVGGIYVPSDHNERIARRDALNSEIENILGDSRPDHWLVGESRVLEAVLSGTPAIDKRDDLGAFVNEYAGSAETEVRAQAEAMAGSSLLWIIAWHADFESHRLQAIDFQRWCAHWARTPALQAVDQPVPFFDIASRVLSGWLAGLDERTEEL